MDSEDNDKSMGARQPDDDPRPGWRTDEAYEAEVWAVVEQQFYRKFLSRSSTWQFLMIQWPNPTEMF